MGLFVLATTCFIVQVGCQAVDFYSPLLHPPIPQNAQPPSELSMVSLPAYRIEPPDVVRIEVVKLVPHPTYRIEPFDVLQIKVLGAVNSEPIGGYYLVDQDGIVHLGLAYGEFHFVGLTLKEATEALTKHLQRSLIQPDVTVQLARSSAMQNLTGLFPVQPDGTLNLRRYGMVHISGKTVTEARQAVEVQLAEFFDSPQATVEVVNYKSANYYVIVAGTLSGEKVRSYPITGNETILDALSQVEGLSNVSSKTLWIARPAPQGAGCEEILPVDWIAVSQGGETATNYQLLPGDRLYVVDDGLVAANDFIGRFTNPIQRVLSLSALGASTIRNTQMLGRGYNRRLGPQ